MKPSKLILFCTLIACLNAEDAFGNHINYQKSETVFSETPQWSRQLLLRGDTASLTDFQKEQIIALNMVRTQPKYYAQQILQPLINALKTIPKEQNQIEWEVHFNWEKAPRIIIKREETWRIIWENTSAFRNAAESLYTSLTRMAPVGILSANRALMQAAQKHAVWMQKTDTFSHTGEAKSDISKRLKNEGIQFGLAGENIQYSGYTPYLIVLDLLIDEGIPGYGHRENILNATFSAIGIGRAGNYHCQNFTELK
jgi:uncharacterized protein YkwD